MELFVNSE